MIDPKDLRIGNIVLTNFNPKGGKVPTVMDEVYFKKLLDYGGDEFYPIPLTQEIYEKAGFKQFEKGWHEIIKDSIHISIAVGNRNICIGDEYDAAAPPVILHDRQIKYLHQLQNFYYTLTGEELQINI